MSYHFDLADLKEIALGIRPLSEIERKRAIKIICSEIDSYKEKDFKLTQDKEIAELCYTVEWIHSNEKFLCQANSEKYNILKNHILDMTNDYSSRDLLALSSAHIYNYDKLLELARDNNILLSGPASSGKSSTVERLTKDIPSLTVVDSSKLSDLSKHSNKSCPYICLIESDSPHNAIYKLTNLISIYKNIYVKSQEVLSAFDYVVISGKELSATGWTSTYHIYDVAKLDTIVSIVDSTVSLC